MCCAKTYAKLFLHNKNKRAGKRVCQRGRCIRLFAPTAEGNAKSHLNLTQIDLSTAVSAGRSGEVEDGDFKA